MGCKFVYCIAKKDLNSQHNLTILILQTDHLLSTVVIKVNFQQKLDDKDTLQWMWKEVYLEFPDGWIITELIKI